MNRYTSCAVVALSALAWSSPAQAQDTLFHELVPGAAASNPRELTYVKELDRTFFSARHPSLGRELWVTDNSSRSPTVLDLGIGAADPKDLTVLGADGAPVGGTQSGGAVLAFTANRPGGGGAGRGVFLSDAKGVRELAIPRKSSVLGSSLVCGGRSGAVWSQVLWFSTRSSSGTQRLWRYRHDRRTGTTEPLALMFEGVTRELTNVSGVPYWVCDTTSGAELWRVQGSGARRISTFRRISHLFAAQPYLILAAAALDGSTGLELFQTHLSQSATRLLEDTFPGPAGSDPAEFVRFGKFIYFAATTPADGRELRRIELGTGSSVHSQRLTDLVAGAGSSSPMQLTAAPFRSVLGGDPGSLLYFTATTPATGRELWTMDVHQQPRPLPRLVREIVPGPNGIDVGERIHYGSGEFLVFALATASTGAELWCSDGTGPGTRRLADIYPGPVDSEPSSFRQHGVDLLYSANQPGRGRELHRLHLGQFGVFPPVLAKHGVGGSGTRGARPRVDALSVPRPGQAFGLMVTRAPSHAPVVLLLAPGITISSLPLTLEYGCTYALPTAGVPISIGAAANVYGVATLGFGRAMAGVPTGSTLTAQFLAFDPEGCFRDLVSPSDALRIAIGPPR